MISKQEMFNRAWSGLKAQGFRQATKLVTEDGAVTRRCVYLSDDGCRCAWGHVDTTLTNQEMTLKQLWTNKIGIAGELDAVNADFAAGLQQCHDSVNPNSPTVAGDMEDNLRRYAIRYELQVPA